ncbi:MAG TPA: SDR family oxidoreductase [Chiayiivirga sp.]|nr:SDR family oxidoreductase [Chiayiivirga sp.]HRP71735.1 SDR family oxidoreductase [Luteimonas sp.]
MEGVHAGLDFSARKVLVVGGSSGIGNGIAHAFRSLGAQVHVWGTRATAADYADSDGSDLQGLGYTQVDVSDPDAIAAAPAPFDGLDVLVLSQGSVLYKRQEFERAGWDKVMAINLDSVMHCARRFEEQLERSRGSVIVVSSIAAYMATLGTPAYAASKAGAVSLTATLAQAWAPRGIRVNGIAPGMVETKLTKVTTENPQRRERAMSKIPLSRFGQPQDMAGVALFLASPLSAYVTGQTIVVDGGLTL